MQEVLCAWRTLVTWCYRMISFANIHKQYGKQLVFVDASFQLNPGEKVGAVQVTTGGTLSVTEV